MPALGLWRLGAAPSRSPPPPAGSCSGRCRSSAFVVVERGAQPSRLPVRASVTFPAAAPADFYADRAVEAVGLPPSCSTPPSSSRSAPRCSRWSLGDRRGVRPAMLFCWSVAGLAAALMPTPTWRQYLLPLLPPLFVHARLDVGEAPARRDRPRPVRSPSPPPASPPPRRRWRAAARRWPARGATARRSARRWTQRSVAGPVATLSPQFLPRAGESPTRASRPAPSISAAVTCPHLPTCRWWRAATSAAWRCRPRSWPAARTTWTSGDARLDRALESEAARRGYRRIGVAGTRWRLWVR